MYRLVGLQLSEPEESQILADTLTLFQSGGTDYAHHITAFLKDFAHFKSIFRPLFAIIFSPKIVIFDTYSIWARKRSMN